MRIRQLIGRTAICFYALLIYCLLFNWYIYELVCDTGTLSYRETKLIKEYANLFITGFFAINVLIPSNEPYHKQANYLCILAVCWNYIFNILIQHNFINQIDAPYYFLVFNGAIVAITIAVTWEAIRYGIFEMYE